MRWTNEQWQEYLSRIQKYSSNEKADPGPEAELARKILKYCKEHGYPVQYFRQTPRVQRVLTPGWPDMTIVMSERVVFIELKSAEGYLRKEQKKMAQVFSWLGHPIHQVRSYKRFLEVIRG